jgi:hypothetical protein
LCSHLAIFDVEDQEYLKQYSKPMATAGPAKMAELSIRVKLTAGHRYIIVPTTKDLNKEGKFFLSLYFSCELHDVDIERIGHPEERCKSLKSLTYV